MMLGHLQLCWMFCTLACGLAIPKMSTNRIYDTPLTDEQHYDNEEHNANYDHEAFLGEDEAKTFDQLTPEESIKRLSIIVDKIDKDQDGLVTKKELNDWIEYTQKRFILNDIERQWKAHNSENKELLSWDDYKKVSYGFVDEENLSGSPDDSSTYKDMLVKDKRRWEAADLDKDNAMNKEEFGHFLHPEESKHMHDIVVQETLDDIDKDMDGKLSLEEYIGDMYGGEDEEMEPDWVKNERDQFNQYRDLNKDGFMDKEEVRQWILPSDYDHSDAESRHLIYEADANKDDMLSKQEILDKYDLFVGSQATDFGEALMQHDEF